ncbi:MAG: glycosyltransferase [Gemmatimonadota bacterium]
MTSSSITLVIPGRNTALTLHACLKAVVPYLGSGLLREIMYVDDGSTDQSSAIAAAYPARVLDAGGLGPGGARNVGWKAASTDLVWFIDADCVARPGALEALQAHLRAPAVGGAGGSYANEVPGSLLGTLIHAEIVARHRRMPTHVGYLATYNVLYRRSVLESLGGFDEVSFNAAGKPGAEDIDLAYRASAAGWILHFEPRSLVGHYHPTKLLPYLKTQRRHGFWRVALHLKHRKQGGGDDYSGPVDHAQPFVGIAAVLATPLAIGERFRPLMIGLWAVLLALQLPMMLRLLSIERGPRALVYAPLGAIRAVWRGFGMCAGVVARMLRLAGSVR